MAILIRLLPLLLLGSLTEGQNQNATKCAVDRWGPDCQNVCGECYVTEAAAQVRRCDLESGTCAHGCKGDYTGTLCDEAKCNDGCGAGICIAPGICANCGDINKVAPNCEDIRLRGLIGSAIAFVVVLSSVALCGLGSVWYKRRANAAVAL